MPEDKKQRRSALDPAVADLFDRPGKVLGRLLDPRDVARVDGVHQPCLNFDDRSDRVHGVHSPDRKNPTIEWAMESRSIR